MSAESPRHVRNPSRLLAEREPQLARIFILPQPHHIPPRRPPVVTLYRRCRRAEEPQQCRAILTPGGRILTVARRIMSPATDSVRAPRQQIRPLVRIRNGNLPQPPLHVRIPLALREHPRYRRAPYRFSHPIHPLDPQIPPQRGARNLINPGPAGPSKPAASPVRPPAGGTQSHPRRPHPHVHPIPAAARCSH